MNIYARIKALRLQKGMSQAELAEKVGYVGRSAISKVEMGQRDISQSMIAKYAEALGVTPAYLLYGEDANPSMGTNVPDNILPVPKLRIPIVGTIAAGVPLLASENIDGFVDLEKKGVDFALRIKGDSMIDAGIHTGDLVLIKQQDDVDDGQIAVVLVDDEATLKRIYRSGDSVTLIAANPAFPPMIFKEADAHTIKVLGKAVYVLSKIG